MSLINIYRDTCSGCGGDGTMPGAKPEDPESTCPMCGGSGKQLLGKIEGIPTFEQFQNANQQIQGDLDSLKTGVEAIWNKVKDL